jgi:hypothetical protein
VPAEHAAIAKNHRQARIGTHSSTSRGGA